MLRWFGSSAAGSSSAVKGLPRPSGPFSVGFLDLEWLPQASQHVSQPPGYVLARIYYPSLPITHHDQDSDDAVSQAWSGRSHWIPSPAYFPAGNTLIWAVEGAPLTTVERMERFPLVVFSHGLGGMRTTYSSLCTDLASHGYVVAALEHRKIRRAWLGWREWFQRLWTTPTYSEQSLLMSRRHGYRDGSASMSWMPQDETILQYQHPPQQWDDSEAQKFRNEQLQHRRQEVSALIDALVEVSPDKTLDNLWKISSGRETSTRSDIGNVLPGLRDRIDARAITMAGHSFGAATTFFASREDERIQAALVLDPWMYPLTASFLQEGIGRPIPLLVITSETFSWPGNKEALAKVLQVHQGHARQITIRGSGHLDQSDFKMVVPEWLLRRYRTVSGVDSRWVLEVNSRMIRAFVDRIVGRIDDPLEKQLQKLVWEEKDKIKDLRLENLLIDF